MPTKKTAKKKTAAQLKKQKAEKNALYLVRKKAKKLDAVIDAVVAPPVIPVAPLVPATVTLPPFGMEEDDFNEFAPDQQAGTWQNMPEPEVEEELKPEVHDEEETPEGDVYLAKQPTPTPEAPSLGQGEPVNASDDPLGDVVPQDVIKALTDLIDGMNYLYEKAKLVKGYKGLKQHDEDALRARVKTARTLIANLS